MVWRNIAASLLFVSSLQWHRVVDASLVNITVDDTYGDLRTGNKWTYNPPDWWRNSSDSRCTSDCTPGLDLTRTMNGTFHVSAVGVSTTYTTLAFTGIHLFGFPQRGSN